MLFDNRYHDMPIVQATTTLLPRFFPAVWVSTNRQAPSAADLVQNANYGSERDPWSTIMDASRAPLTINILSMAILDGGEEACSMFKAHHTA